ncbi:hypothetical protein KCP76_08045 [Salmonella enterica subsp. enterica serovar Weltevreden]|nr:hypothetical protein KCP76_08045 [Salmonella enterica subsp. enterica serovar Weltevreden]
MARQESAGKEIENYSTDRVRHYSGAAHVRNSAGGHVAGLTSQERVSERNLLQPKPPCRHRLSYRQKSGFAASEIRYALSNGVINKAVFVTIVKILARKYSEQMHSPPAATSVTGRIHWVRYPVRSASARRGSGMPVTPSVTRKPVT